MPRAWSDREKQTIKNILVTESRRLFEQYGLMKTTVDDIVKAAKISKGAFYSFYGSKEELYFDILEIMEKDFHATIYGSLGREGVPRRKVFGDFIKTTIDILVTNRIYAQLNLSDMEYLLRTLPEETVKKHVHNDFERLGTYFGEWMEKGWMRKVELDALSGLLMSIIYLVFQRESIPGINFDKTRDLLADMITDYLVIDE